MKRIAIIAALVVAAVALAQTMVAPQPGKDGDRFMSATVGTRSGEICVPTTYDGGAIYDAGTGLARETYNVLVVPPGARGFLLTNRSTTATISWLCGARSTSVPIAGAYGDPIESRGAGTGAYFPSARRNIGVSACSEIHLVSSANQTSGADAGTGCLSFEFGL